MDDKIRRVRCGTKKCTGFVDAKVSTIPKSKDGNWQFQCPICNFWCLLSDTGMVKATSREQFELDRLSPSLRSAHSVTRSPVGGV
jgi:hypothetical protein